MPKMMGAQWVPWSPYQPERFITPRVIVLHTNDAHSVDPQAHDGLSWHFQIEDDGTVVQHRDTSTEAAAQYDANAFAISIETEDDGDPSTPWTDAQVASILRVIDWCCTTHATIPRAQVETWDGSGIGGHRWFEQWNHDGHTCPGDVRDAQLRNVIIPAVTGGQVPAPAPAASSKPAADAPPFVWRADAAPMPHGRDVGWVQHVLASYCGQDLGPTGVDTWYGQHTAAAVTNLQTFFGIGVDGRVGPETWGVVCYVAALHGE